MATIIGLTGGIASGKSTVTDYLCQQGYAVVDADQVVHELQSKGGRLYERLVEAFGKGILDEQGDLDRPALSAQVFANPDLRAQLSRLQDEVIREELAFRRDCLAKAEPVFFMDIPLLFELGYEEWFDEIWLIHVDRETQVQRLMVRSGYSLEEARSRLSAQWSLDSKIPRASHVIDNRGPLSETYRQVQHLLASFSKKNK